MSEQLRLDEWQPRRDSNGHWLPIPVETGRRFGRLMLLYETTKRDRRRFGVFRCECGREKEQPLLEVIRGKTISCGCFGKERQREAVTTHGHTIGHKPSREYRSWAAMWARCTDPKKDSWESYGGAGITVDPRWKNFATFLADMGPMPNGRYTIDRIENARGYAPDNCRWATDKQQQRNKRNNKHLFYAGRSQPIAAWAEELNLPRKMLEKRIRVGWDIERALKTPPIESKRRYRVTKP